MVCTADQATNVYKRSTGLACEPRSTPASRHRDKPWALIVRQKTSSQLYWFSVSTLSVLRRHETLVNAFKRVPRRVYRFRYRSGTHSRGRPRSFSPLDFRNVGGGRGENRPALKKKKSTKKRKWSRIFRARFFAVEKNWSWRNFKRRKGRIYSYSPKRIKNQRNNRDKVVHDHLCILYEAFIPSCTKFIAFFKEKGVPFKEKFQVSWNVSPSIIPPLNFEKIFSLKIPNQLIILLDLATSEKINITFRIYSSFNYRGGGRGKKGRKKRNAQ